MEISFHTKLCIFENMVVAQSTEVSWATARPEVPPAKRPVLFIYFISFYLEINTKPEVTKGVQGQQSVVHMFKGQPEQNIQRIQ